MGCLCELGLRFPTSKSRSKSSYDVYEGVSQWEQPEEGEEEEEVDDKFNQHLQSETLLHSVFEVEIPGKDYEILDRRCLSSGVPNDKSTQGTCSGEEACTIPVQFASISWSNISSEVSVTVCSPTHCTHIPCDIETCGELLDVRKTEPNTKAENLTSASVVEAVIFDILNQIEREDGLSWSSDGDMTEDASNELSNPKVKAECLSKIQECFGSKDRKLRNDPVHITAIKESNEVADTHMNSNDNIYGQEPQENLSVHEEGYENIEATTSKTSNGNHRLIHAGKEMFEKYGSMTDFKSHYNSSTVDPYAIVGKYIDIEEHGVGYVLRCVFLSLLIVST